MKINLSQLPERAFRKHVEAQRLYDLALAEPDPKAAAELKRRAFALLQKEERRAHILVEAHRKEVARRNRGKAA